MPAAMVIVVVAPVAVHVPSPGLWANTSSVTLSVVTAPLTLSVPVVTRLEQDTEILVMAWLVVGLASAPADSGLPIVPKPISARPPAATAAPARRTPSLPWPRSTTLFISRRAV